jgi:hypothetical protein
MTAGRALTWGRAMAGGHVMTGSHATARCLTTAGNPPGVNEIPGGR